MAYGWMLCPALTKDDLIVLQATWQSNYWKAQLVSLAMYGEPDDPRFAAIFQEPHQRRWRVELGITSPDDFNARAQTQAADGYFATIITGTGSNDPTVPGPYGLPGYYQLTAVFEELAPAGMPVLVGPAPFSANLGVNWPTHVIRSADSFGMRGPPSSSFNMRHVALYTAQPPSTVGWGYHRHEDISKGPDTGALMASSHHQAVRDCWARVEHAVPDRWEGNGIHPASVLYRNDVYEPWPADLQAYTTGGSPTYGPLDLATLNAVHAGCVPHGVWPHRIGANGPIFDPRFMLTVVPQNRNTPKVRYFFAFNENDPDQPDHVVAPRRTRTKATGTIKLPDGPPVDPIGSDEIARFRRTPRWGRQDVHGAVRWRTDLAHKSPISAANAAFSGQGLGGLSFDASPADVSDDGFGLSGNAGPPLQIKYPSFAELIAAIDDIVRLYMERSNARTAQLFIGIDGKGALGRNYTYAELGYRMTKSQDKLAIASNSKALTGMAFAGELSDAPGLTIDQRLQPFRDLKLVDAIGMTDQEVSMQELASPGDGPRLLATNIEHLLRHQGCWNPNFPWAQQAAQVTGQNPLRAGSMILGLRQGASTIPMYAADPGSDDPYDGANYVILSEIFSRIKLQADDQYIRAMRGFWQHEFPEQINGPAVVMPWTRADALSLGIAPMVTLYPHANRAFLPDEPNQGTAPWRPGPWSHPYEWFAAGGGWAMSMKTLAKILQGMHPNPAPNVLPLLGKGQVAALVSPSAIQPAFCLGFGVFQAAFPKPFAPSSGDLNYYRAISHAGGGVATGSIVAHLHRIQGWGPLTISVALTVVSEVQQDMWGDASNPGVQQIIYLVQKAFHLGYFDNAPDLFATP